MTFPPRILAIDPGYAQSAWLVFDAPAFDAPGHVDNFGISPNSAVLELLREGLPGRPGVIVIEQFESFGMIAGREVFETIRWAGRFEEAAHPTPVELLPRRAVKLAICHDSRAKDANIRAALIDRFGGAAAIGRKADQGPLYGIAKDVWSALAIAVTYADQLGGGPS